MGFMDEGFYLLLWLASYFVICVEGHGRLLEPPSRASMWRVGFNTPANYNDNAMYCGGFQTQWGQNGGKCGVCGDPYHMKREHEAGGKYATGKIVRRYSEGQVIEVNVQITANHKGWFQFKLCPNNNPHRRVTQQCLDRFVLRAAVGAGTRYNLGGRKGLIKLRYQLPPGVVCSQCVLQWKWTTGNSWGVDAKSKKGCIGCGAQEQFYGCADIAISRGAGRVQKVNVNRNAQRPPLQKVNIGNTYMRTLPRKVNIGDTYKRPILPKVNVYKQPKRRLPLYPRRKPSTESDAWLRMGFTYPKHYRKYKLIHVTKAAPKSREVTVKVPKRCQSYGEWAGQVGMSDWCTQHCNEGFCPKSHCKCDWISVPVSSIKS